MKFKDLNLSKDLLDAIEKVGYSDASEVQKQVIPAAMEGRDVIAQAPTGTGKTAAFAIPLLELTEVGKGFQHLILVPSRELASQITQEFRKLASFKRVNVVEILGGVSYDIQRRDIKSNPEIIVATPGRFMDHLESGRITIDLSKVKTFTLDEADEMLSFGFQKDMIKISKMLPQPHQTIFITATFNKKIKELGQELLTNPFKVEVSSAMSTNDKIDQRFIVLKEKEKFAVLAMLLQLHKPKAAIIFGRTKRRVDELTMALNELGFAAIGIQGDMKQKERSIAMKRFREGTINILVGTDVMARGIDVEAVDFVFNFDLPLETEYYTHRIGRTGRAGKTGTAISFVKDSEQVAFTRILRDTNSVAKQMEAPDDGTIMDAKEAELDSRLMDLLDKGQTKYAEKGAKIAHNFTKEQLGMIIAAALIGETKDFRNVNLTAESTVDDKGGRGRRSGGGSSRGGSYGGGSRGGSSHGGSRGGSSHRSSDRGPRKDFGPKKEYSDRGPRKENSDRPKFKENKSGKDSFSRGPKKEYRDKK